MIKELSIKLKDTTTNKIFIKQFDCEFDKEKFLRKLKYSKKLILIDDYKKYYDYN